MLNTTIEKNTTKNKYKVEGIFWDPMYRDFDIGDFEVSAYTKKQAEYLAKMHWMWQFAKKPPAIVKIEDDYKTNDPRAPKWALDHMEQLIDDYTNSDINR